MQSFYSGARITLDTRQKLWLYLLSCIVLMAIYWHPEEAKIIFLIISQLAYLTVNIMQTILLYTGWRHHLPMPELSITTLMANDLPKYTILLPLYKEAAILPNLVANIEALKYDHQKLEVFLVLEEDDTETQAAAAQLDLPSFFKIIIVPDSQPKTKGKACNYALQYATGELLVIYDAEDAPEPMQLLMAVNGFRNAPDTVVCLQAYLSIEMAQQNWLTTMFTIEYHKQFQYLLPAIRKFGLLIPLGGTSNHLKTAFLKSIGGWDAYNVTEDADLGVRIAIAGKYTDILPCETREAATNNLPAWLKQRRRWHKGFMQTLCVYLRRPLHLLKTLGSVNFLFFMYQFGLLMFTPLITPVLIICTVSSLAWSEPMLLLALSNLFLGSSIYVLGAHLVLKKRKQKNGLLLLSISKLAYLCLYIPASIAALWQLCTRPHYWDKTEHKPNP